MNEIIRTRERTAATAALDAAAQGGVAENAWPWFMGFCGMLTIFLYREALRLMLWARSLNY